MYRIAKVFIITCILSLFYIPLSGIANPVTQFVENKGQWNKDVLFKASVPGGDLYILRNKLKYDFYQRDSKGHHGHFDDQTAAFRKAPPATEKLNLHHSVEVSFVGSNASSQITGEDVQFSNINFIKGPDHQSHNVRSFAKVKMENLYQGIDLILYANDVSLKYDLLVNAGADPSRIKMKYNGQNSLMIQDGKLVINTVFGLFHENMPVAYNLSNNQRSTVEAQFATTVDEVSFSFPKGYNPNQRLVIDPELIFSTYSGSFADNWGFTATYDEEGNLYSGGIVLDTGYPVTNGVYQPSHGGEWDVGILKYSPTGKDLIWATYLGGSFSETPQSIIVNSRGELIIYGTTSSPDFPMTNNSFSKDFLGGDPIYDTAGVAPRLVGGVSMRNGTDIFLAILSNDGRNLIGSTFIGGTENDGVMERLRPLTKNYGDQFRGEVNLDRQDNIYVASNTSSPDFTVKNAAQSAYGGSFNDGVIMKFNADLSDLFWSTYAGGSGMDALYSVKVDLNGNVFAAGGSTSTDFPTTIGSIKTENIDSLDIDGVVVKLSPDGSKFLSATYLGTPQYDQVYFLELDSSNQVYVLGQTQGEYLVTQDVYSNENAGQFIHKMNNDLDSTYFSTTIGSGSGSPDFSPTAFLVNECENIFVSGWGGILNHPVTGYIGGNTIGLPITDNAYQSQTDGDDFYLMVLLQDAEQLLYSTFFGEINGRGEHVDGGTSRFDKKGIVYQSVCGGCGGSSGFPTFPQDVWSTTNNSNNCNNAAFKFDLASLAARFQTDTEDFMNRGIRAGCYPLTLVFLNESIGGEDFLWELGRARSQIRKTALRSPMKILASIPVVLTATDINTCVRESKARGTITVYDYEFGIMPNDSICYGEEIILNASGGVVYDWEPKSSLENSNTANPVASPDSTTTYAVRIQDTNGCEWEDSLEIKVIPEITSDFSYIKEYDCHQGPLIKFTNNSENASKFLWDFGDGTNSEEVDTQHQYQASDSVKTYQVQLSSGESFCSENKIASITTVTPFVPNFISPNGDGKNDVFEIRADGQIELNIYNRWGRPVYMDKDYRNTWGSPEIASGVYFYELIFSDKNTRCNGWIHVMH
jgi:gliding motility-associated-like protein